MKVWVSQHTGEPEPLPGPALSKADLAEGVLWPYPPEWTVRFALEEEGWLLDVEIAYDDDGKYYVTGIVVRSGSPTSPSGTQQDPWLDGEYEPVVPRDVQRLPLTTYQRAALAIVKDPLTGEGRREMKEILVPRGRPADQPGPEFYADLLATARELEAQSVRPVPEIARRKRVTQNVVHQWLHRARLLEAKAGEDSPSL